jgi:hypothetical protein
MKVTNLMTVTRIHIAGNKSTQRIGGNKQMIRLYVN